MTPPTDVARLRPNAGTKGFVGLPLAERFWAKVDKGDGSGCWLWTGAVRSRERPYGMIWDHGRTRPASKVAWELNHGKPFPDGMDGCHRCDNPRCVRPSHIFPGTMSDNIRDARDKGRLVIPDSPRRSFCARGHALTPENVCTTPSTGDRQCRTCRDMKRKAWGVARRAALAALLEPATGAATGRAGEGEL